LEIAMKKLAVNFAAAALLGGMTSIRRSEDDARKQKAAIFSPAEKQLAQNAVAAAGEFVQAQKQERSIKVTKFDEDKQIVYGMVYAPDTLDTYGEYMKAEDIETMAHRYLSTLKLDETIDVKHDNVARNAYPVESFIARKGDPDYPEGAWVLGVKVEDDAVWASIKKGELNGFSFESMVVPVEATVTYEVVRDHVGPVCKADGFDHDHVLFVQLGDDGKVMSGRTSKAADGHFHEVTRASVTEAADGHTHRFFL
jgi:hypothetical protein